MLAEVVYILYGAPDGSHMYLLYIAVTVFLFLFLLLVQSHSEHLIITVLFSMRILGHLDKIWEIGKLKHGT
jgi:hypothetical protein